MNRFALLIGPIMCSVAIALGAFGTHAIADLVTPARLDTWQTAARYLMTHGLGLFAIGILSQQLKSSLMRPSLMIAIGSLLFSSVLFILVLTNMTWLGAIAPIGGLLLILGWLDLAFSIYKTTKFKANT